MAVVHYYFEPIPIPDLDFQTKIRVQNLQNMFKTQKNLKGKNIDSLRRRTLGSVFFSDLAFLRLNTSLL